MRTSAFRWSATQEERKEKSPRRVMKSGVERRRRGMYSTRMKARGKGPGALKKRKVPEYEASRHRQTEREAPPKHPIHIPTAQELAGQKEREERKQQRRRRSLLPEDIHSARACGSTGRRTMRSAAAAAVRFMSIPQSHDKEQFTHAAFQFRGRVATSQQNTWP
jgi:hypothetical protein